MECRTGQGLTDVFRASKCADNLLLEVDKTSDSPMFLNWAMSLPQNRSSQEKLREELSFVAVNEQGVPGPKDLSQLPYLNAVMKETLCLYAALPTLESK